MKKTIFSLLLTLLAFTTAAAQNSIDKLTNEFSTNGSKYTSVVVRNPKTRKVENTVKKLTLNNTPSARKKFEQAFRAEADTGTLLNLNQNTPRHALVLTVEEPRFTCVYMMRNNNNSNGSYIEITIIKTFK